MLRLSRKSSYGQVKAQPPTTYTRMHLNPRQRPNDFTSNPISRNVRAPATPISTFTPRPIPPPASPVHPYLPQLPLPQLPLHRCYFRSSPDTYTGPRTSSSARQTWGPGRTVSHDLSSHCCTLTTFPCSKFVSPHHIPIYLLWLIQWIFCNPPVVIGMAPPGRSRFQAHLLNTRIMA
ncbi:hypothetical protein L208DRAFT_291127 [Tricholoma matsutake]|nr:hypothetical protein L208DRAFT_291127 [Tricholoma matsutake 945]